MRKDSVIVFLMSLFVTAALFAAVLDYFSLPVVGVTDDGTCVYIIEQGEKRACDKKPSRAIEEYVANREQRQLRK